MRPSFLLFLAACEQVDPADEAQRLPGDQQVGPPITLEISRLVPGQPVTLRVLGAPPGSNVHFGRGTPGQSCPPSLGGNCLDLAPPITVMVSDIADAAGTAERTVTLPATVPIGLKAYFQAATYTGGSLYKTQVVTRIVGNDCQFGDLLAEVSQGGGMYDQDRVTHDASSVYTSFGGTLYRYDLDLNLIGGPAALPAAGNHGLTYSPVDDVVYNFDTARSVATIAALDATSLAVVRGPSSTGDNTGGAFVDDAGHVHLVRRVAAGFVEMDRNLNIIGNWGTAATGMDGEISADGDTAYQLDLLNGVTLYDFNAPGRPVLSSFAIPTGAGTNIFDISPDSAGNLYAVDRTHGTLYVYDADDGFMVASLSLGATSEPLTVDYHPADHALFVAFYNGGNSVLRKYCAY